MAGLVKFDKYLEFIRWVYISGGPICSFVYALSQRGAHKVLFDLSIDHLKVHLTTHWQASVEPGL